MQTKCNPSQNKKQKAKREKSKTNSIQIWAFARHHFQDGVLLNKQKKLRKKTTQNTIKSFQDTNQKWTLENTDLHEDQYRHPDQGPDHVQILAIAIAIAIVNLNRDQDLDLHILDPVPKMKRDKNTKNAQNKIPFE